MLASRLFTAVEQQACLGIPPEIVVPLAHHTLERPHQSRTTDALAPASSAASSEKRKGRHACHLSTARSHDAISP
eukprot:1140140-Pelagomonas_calceolata.AAC.2